MKYLVLTYLIATTFICSGQSIILSLGQDTMKVSMISEKIGTQVSYDMCFDRVYKLQQEGYLLEEWTDYWVNGYTAYFYIREGFGYEWVIDNINFDTDFIYTLISAEKFKHESK